MYFLKLIRFPNLVIILAIQYLLQYWILRPNLTNAGVEILLDHNLFLLLVISTMIIAATGYIINDIVDIEIDKINKPQKRIVGKVISLAHAWQTYWILVVFGLIISLYVAFRIENILLVFIYPIAIALLGLYSLKLKKMAISGNFVVSLFSMMVAGIVLFAEREAIVDLMSADGNRFLFITFIFYGYMIFAFLTSMFREIIKDIEDIEGDRKQMAKTLPILLGARKSKFISAVFGVVILLLSNGWLYLAYYNEYLTLAIGILFLIILPLIFVLVKLYKANLSAHYHQISILIKCIMAGGIICLLFIRYVE